MVFFCIPCLLLIVYFAVAGIFFPKYRIFLREGWLCFVDKLRGRVCSVSFDNRMRIALSAWLTRRGMVRMGRFLHDERNFNITLTVFAIVSTVVSIYLFIVFVQFLYSPPCTADTCSI